MKKILSVVLVIMLLIRPILADAKEPELKHVKMTCYTHTGNPCRNGKMPREGICAYQSEYLNWLAIVYADNNGNPGEIIGYYEIYDTGYGIETDVVNPYTDENYGSLELGTSIDIFQDSLEECYEFIEEHGDTAFIQIVYAEG